ncbi:MAG TPA: metal ABC transporter permease [Thermoplasmata archaeon]|jgi:zinc transport system permease protein
MADLLELFSLGFMQRALIAGLLAASLCSVLGVFIVLRRTAFLGDALAHTAFGGMALGIFLAVSPTYAALVVVVLGAVAIEILRERGVYGELSVALIYATGLASGIVLVSKSGGLNVSLLSLLFGGILTVTWPDVYLIAVLFGLSASVIIAFYKELFLLTFDPEGARVNGVPTRALNLSFTILTAVTVVLSIKVVGVLLVAALLIAPPAAALQLRLGLRSTLATSLAIAVVSVIGGILLSVILDTATGGTIVLIALLIFFVTLVTGTGPSPRAKRTG